ncbi:hypothetical protein SDC9_15974 [bioreactor metagenome]|uniref:AAA+ ATPase domain-containing protein n=1 Tax=bioreactor metagenome TaxID=1076179 RepID=A0A644TU94_9ZZZZ
MELTINESIRKDIIKQIINSPFFMGDYKNEEGGIITFLEMIWDLRSMPSEDSRFSNARDDIWKHIVMNDDITIEELFLDRLSSSYNEPNVFINLINTSIHPTVMKDEEQRKKLIEFLNELLLKYNYKLSIGDYFGEEPIYVFSDNIKTEMPKGIIPNTIPFFKSEYNKKTYPCLIISPCDWNDWYKWKTLFKIVFYRKEYDFIEIGNIKIMKVNEDSTLDVLPDYFTALDPSFCSVGTDARYYLNMKEHVKESYHSVFLALRDVAMFPTIKSEFENDDCFKNSLLRNDETKQLLDSARYILNGIDVKSYYKFSYSFLPPYCSDNDNNDNIVNIDFDFKYGTSFNQRIYALIGKNGTGKTTLLSQIANDFANSNSKHIIPQKPLYNKIITISFSSFDKLPLPSPNAQFNYTYLGLKNTNNKDSNIDIILERKLKKSLIEINRKNRNHIWNSTIKKIFHNDIQDKLLEDDNLYNKVDIDKVLSSYKCFSSGENLLLYIVSSLISEIQNNTLILFDEPETHLHPNAISILMNFLYNLLDGFNSFCIIATHSPLVVQEVSSRNIKVFIRIGNLLEIQGVGYETFAENLTTITNEIFDNREIAQYHIKIMNEIVDSHQKETYDNIISIFQNGDIPTPLNVKLYIKELLKNEKSKTI